MQILFVGYLGRGQTSGMRAEAFRRLGHTVEVVEAGGLWSGAPYLQRLWEQRQAAGKRIEQFNTQVLAAARRCRPRMVWAEKQEYLMPDTVAQLQRAGAAVVHYTPDPYFTLAWKRTPLADEAMRRYDAVVVTKTYELDAYRQHARGQVVYAPLGYDAVKHVPASATVREHYRDFACDVAFVGGWEARRERMLDALCRDHIAVKVWGYGWRIAQQPVWHPLRMLRLGRLEPGAPLYVGRRRHALAGALQPGEAGHGEIYEERYAAAVGLAKISLAFLRQVCPDQHTTRTFEIPAMGGFLLADRTDEHQSFFEEDEEAAFFSSEEECLSKARFYLGHDAARRRIAEAGYRRCTTSGYAYDDRLRTVLQALNVGA